MTTRRSLRRHMAYGLASLCLASCSARIGTAPPTTDSSSAEAAAAPAAASALVADVDTAATRIEAASAASPELAWRRLVDMVDSYGSRITGSRALEQALGWSAEQMRSDGLANVRLEPVRVPHWVR